MMLAALAAFVLAVPGALVWARKSWTSGLRWPLAVAIGCIAGEALLVALWVPGRIQPACVVIGVFLFGSILGRMGLEALERRNGR